MLPHHLILDALIIASFHTNNAHKTLRAILGLTPPCKRPRQRRIAVAMTLNGSAMRLEAAGKLDDQQLCFLEENPQMACKHTHLGHVDQCTNET